MRIIIYVFSGTGNTLKVANEYKTELKKQGAEADIFRIKGGKLRKKEVVPYPDDYDIAGVAYPIHGFNAPKIVVDFAKGLKTEKETPVFVFKTSGEPLSLNDASSQKLWRVLEKNGFTAAFERHYVMPYNMLFRHTDEMAQSMWDCAKEMVRLDTKELLFGKREDVKQPLRKRLHTGIFRIEWLFARLHGRAYKVDKKKCADCGKCVSVCPTGNIKKTDKGYKFGGDCTLCAGCSFGCPKDAIKIGILNKWKVNGAYVFEKPDNTQAATDGQAAEMQIDESYDDGISYDGKLKKAYENYFESCIVRLNYDAAHKAM